MKQVLIFSTLIACLRMLTGVTQANEIMVSTPEGEIFVLSVDPNEMLGDLQQKIASLSNGNNRSFVIEFGNHQNLKEWCLKKIARAQGGYLGYPRNYHVDLSLEERSDIRFIVTSLANKSLISIALAEADLKAAGDRIEHIHPLRFLMTVFTDEELKVAVRNIRGRGWIWSHFISGLKEALAAEADIGNMKSDFVHHFAQTVRIDPQPLFPLLANQCWDDFIDLLITYIPRMGDYDRYDT